MWSTGSCSCFSSCFAARRAHSCGPVSWSVNLSRRQAAHGLGYFRSGAHWLRRINTRALALRNTQSPAREDAVLLGTCSFYSICGIAKRPCKVDTQHANSGPWLAASRSCTSDILPHVSLLPALAGMSSPHSSCLQVDQLQRWRPCGTGCSESPTCSVPNGSGAGHALTTSMYTVQI
jgi:hypothetical protein